MVITNVTTAAELQQAVLNDKPNILITRHLDLTNLPLVDDWRVLGIIPTLHQTSEWVTNIRVRRARMHQ
jgi:hypothetical protein